MCVPIPNPSTGAFWLTNGSPLDLFFQVSSEQQIKAYDFAFWGALLCRHLGATYCKQLQNRFDLG
jgi:hypothetical protein